MGKNMQIRPAKIQIPFAMHSRRTDLKRLTHNGGSEILT